MLDSDERLHVLGFALPLRPGINALTNGGRQGLRHRPGADLAWLYLSITDHHDAYVSFTVTTMPGIYY